MSLMIMITPINPALIVPKVENTVHTFVQVECAIFKIVSSSKTFINEIPWFKVDYPMIPRARVFC